MNYFDASALVKRYVRETGTSTVRRLLREGKAATSRLSEAEISSALSRRMREGSLAKAAHRSAFAALLDDLERIEVVELSPRVVAAAHPLLERYSLRAGDALQLASAVILREALGVDLSMVAYDGRLRDAAAAERFPLRPRTLRPTRGGS